MADTINLANYPWLVRLEPKSEPPNATFLQQYDSQMYC